jgi:hypothetical protein
MSTDRLVDAPAAQVRSLRDPRRLTWCLLVATLAHLSLGMYRVTERSVLSVSVATRSDRVEQAIAVDLTELPEGPAPGGGSPEPEPEGAERATPAQPVLPKKPAPAVARAPETHNIAALADVAPDKADLDDSEPVDPYELVTTAAAAGPADFEAVRPKAVRRRLLDTHRPPTATAPEVMATAREASRYRGYGPGAYGGPGGPGRGWHRGSGVVRRSFAFGGPRGAFRADVCFIPQGTTALSKVTHCPRQATFFTNALNVSPRKFSEGFPGVSDQTEWFAIRYTGKFRVREPGQYTFRLVSDDGAIFYVDGYRIIDNDGIHPPSARTGNMRLTTGEHTMFVSYFQGPRFDIALQLFVTPPGGKECLFGPEI